MPASTINYGYKLLKVQLLRKAKKYLPFQRSQDRVRQIFNFDRLWVRLAFFQGSFRFITDRFHVIYFIKGVGLSKTAIGCLRHSISHPRSSLLA